MFPHGLLINIGVKRGLYDECHFQLLVTGTHFQRIFAENHALCLSVRINY